MTAQLLMAIALLCQNTGYMELARDCQKRIINCAKAKTTNPAAYEEAVTECVLETK